jgi:hypothetical protein
MFYTRVFSSSLFAAAALTLFSGSAQAGCGYDSNFRGTYPMATLLVSPRALPAAVPDALRLPTPVGMWSIQFISQGNIGHNPSIPDGAQIDFGYTQWHADGTEFLNSGTRPPSTQNFCMGVWEQTGFVNYQLNHFALSYDATTGVLNGKVKIGQVITLSLDGNTMTGTFTIDVFDPINAAQVDHLQGTIQATRITVQTAKP